MCARHLGFESVPMVGYEVMEPESERGGRSDVRETDSTGGGGDTSKSSVHEYV